MLTKDTALAILLIFAKTMTSAVAGVHADVQGVIGTNVKIPCDLSIDKTVTLVRWKLGEDTKYTIDFREDDNRPEHYKKDNRMEFIPRPTTVPFMRIINITKEDEGVYACILSSRVRKTEKYYVNLKVIIPPDSITILDKNGREIEGSTSGPFDENTKAEIICQVTGGYPKPTVKWFHGGILLDEAIDSEATSVQRNVLSYGPLTRADLFTKLTCQATNSNQTGVLGKSVKLDINYKPLTVNITTTESPLVANAEFKINCSSSGSRPQAKITWWLDKEPLLTAQELVTDTGNTTLSSLTYTPADNDGGKVLECRSVSTVVDHKPLRSSWVLQIHYKPKVNVSVVPTSADPKEGEKVTFTCDVISNPEFTEISWFVDRRQITEQKWKNIKISNNTLVLSAVTREMAGVYTCLAFNPVGTGTSDPIILHVKYIPVCEERKSVVGATISETIDVICRFKSFPKLTSVKWQFRKSNSTTTDIPPNNFSIKERQSVLKYKVTTPKNFGDLLCWGTNELGEQKEPCLYQVIQASAPEVPTNCTSINRTSHSIIVKCIEANNGGLTQQFHAEVFDIFKTKNIKNDTFTEPLFIMDKLPHSTDFLLTIYSSNSKGTSEKNIIQVNTIFPTEEELRSISAHSFPIAPILGVLIGIVGALVVVAMVVMVVMKLRSPQSDKKKKPKNEASKPLNRDDSDHPSSKILNDSDIESGTIPEKLKHINYYEQQTTFKPEDDKKAYEMQGDISQDSEYAELLFTKSGKKKKSKKNGKAKKLPDSTIYASIDHVQTEKQKLIMRQKQVHAELKNSPLHLQAQDVPTPPPTPPPGMPESPRRGPTEVLLSRPITPMYKSPEVLIASPVTASQKKLEVKSEPQGQLLHKPYKTPKSKDISPRKSLAKPTNLDRPPIAKKPESLKKKKRTAETQTLDLDQTIPDEPVYKANLAPMNDL